MSISMENMQDNNEQMTMMIPRQMKAETHPLLLSPVTCKIMEYLSIRDLLNCRLVCHQWNQGSCLSLRQKKRKTIKFRMKLEDLEQYARLMEKSPDLPFCFYELEFFDMSHPIVDFFLETCGKTMNSLQLNMCRCTTLKIAEILQQQAKQLKSFSMNVDPIEDLGSIFNVLKTSTGAKSTLPHLKSLSLIGEHSQNQQLISDLIEAAINLESIHFRCYDLQAERSPFEIMCFDVLTVLNNNNNNCSSSSLNNNNNNTHNINHNNNGNNTSVSFNTSGSVGARYLIEDERRRQCQTLKKLTKFQMHYRLDNNEQLVRLSQKNLKLTHLNLNINCDQISPAVLFNLLLGLSPTLENLELDFGAGLGSREKLYRFPILGKLTRLVLTQFKGSSLSYLINGNYTCNSLRSISLINCHSLNTSFFDLDQITNNNNNHNNNNAYPNSVEESQMDVEKRNSSKCLLESLVISSLIEDPEVITRISSVFPNLISLDVQLTNDTLRKVFERLPNLQELMVFCGDRINDEGITGISEEDLIWLALEDDENMMDYENNYDLCHHANEDLEEIQKQLQQNSTREEKADEEDDDGRPKAKKRQYRKFPYIGDLENLRVLKIHEGQCLSDASVIHGFIHNKSLVSVSLTNSQITDISLRSIAERLTSLRKFETLSPNSIFTHEEKNYLRKKLYMCDFILGHQDLLLIHCPKKFSSQMEMVLDFFSN